jgi:hypothetical protein
MLRAAPSVARPFHAVMRVADRLAAACVVVVVVFSSSAAAASRMCTSADTLSFGQRAIGTSTSASVTVSNCGDAPFTFTDVSVHAATNPAYRIETSCATALTLAPLESCALAVFFEPIEPGQASGALWLHNTTANPDQLVTFYGRGVDAQAGTATLAFSPAVADFGAQAVGSESASLTLALVNTGAATLVPSALVVNGPNPYDFRSAAHNTASDCGVGKPIAPGASCTLLFYFRPQQQGTRNAYLVVDAPQLATLAFVALIGTGAATPTPQPATLDVVEFHNRSDDQYFITADAGEIALLDGGGLGPDWSRTGVSFRAWLRDADDPRALPVCRFFGTPGFGPESHFYTAYANECAAVRANAHWIEEGVTFRAMLPSSTGCPDRFLTVSRFWKPGNAVTETRHRYVVDASLGATMRGAGWVAEGPVFCAPQ